VTITRDKFVRIVLIIAYLLLQSAFIFTINPDTSVVILVGLFGGLILWLIWNLQIN
jgi:hypothetical protein